MERWGYFPAGLFPLLLSIPAIYPAQRIELVFYPIGALLHYFILPAAVRALPSFLQSLAWLHAAPIGMMTAPLFVIAGYGALPSFITGTVLLSVRLFFSFFFLRRNNPYDSVRRTV
jgi:hypothetical protein